MTSEPRLQTVEGLWWKRDEEVSIFAVLTNVSRETVTGTYNVTGARGTTTVPQQLAIAPHEMKWIDIGDSLSKLPVGERQVGGISFHYTGAQGALVISGGMENAANGFSAAMRFAFDETQSPDERRFRGEVPNNKPALPPGVKLGTQRSPTGEHTIASVGMMVGKPNPLEGFPEGLRFRPYAVVRNVTASAMRVKGTLNLMTGSKIELPPLAIGAGEARQMDLQASDVPAFMNFDGMVNLTLTHSGSPGDLLVATGSINQTGSYSFEVAANSVGPSGGIESTFWTVGQGYDTMFTLWNSGASAEDLVLTLYHGNDHGSYKLPLHLEANASTTLSMMEIVNQQQPDADGHQLPLDVREGSAKLTSSRGIDQTINAIMSVGVFNAQTGTCVYQDCHYCEGITSFYYLDNPFTLFVSTDQQSRDYVNWSNGSIIEKTTSTSYSSSNASIGTIGTGSTNPGLMHGVSAGDTPFSFTLSSQPLARQVCNTMCPWTGVINGPVTGSIVPKIDSISPPRALIGSSVSVSIQGSGLSGATINAGNGIAATISFNSSTQITATFTIAANSSAGSHAVTVTIVGGQSSNAVDFYVQEPASLTVLSVSTIADGTPGGCIDNTFYGIHIDVRYQVWDQQSTPMPILSAAMIPVESVNGSSYGEVGPNSVMTSEFTDPDGTYHDAPIGSCSAAAFSSTQTQTVQMEVSGAYHSVRTNTFSLSSSSPGHGSISNGSDISKTR